MTTFTTPQDKLDETIARLLDSQFRLPGTNFRFGWDAIIGLIPGVGDIAGTVIGLYFVYRSFQEKIPLRVIVLMILHLLLEMVLGAIPLLGDYFDAYYKASTRNLKLLRAYKKS